MITIFWHCIVSTVLNEGEKFVAGTLDQLAQYLKMEPVKLSINIKRLEDDPELAKKVVKELDLFNDKSYSFSKCDCAIVSAFYFSGLISIDHTAKLLVYCSPRSHIAVAAQREKPHAAWGVTCESFAAVYNFSNKIAIFHEVLHLLGVDDCYVEDEPYPKKTDCNFKHCIMDYNPPKKWCENWPFLCNKNVRVLQNLTKSKEK
ncbi:MAG: hypothetical protein ACYTFW_12890 [Planctomycetota bacterium]|jgi:hypothetical protein